MNSESRKCTICSQNFTLDPTDFSFYEKMGVPVPSRCPDCRFKWRAMFRNERTLYNRKCDRCQKSIISMYNPKSPYTVYCHECYKSEDWDPKSYAMPYDKSRTFIDQLGELLRKVPKVTTYHSSGVGPNVNSEYTNVAGGNKSCYLLFNSGACEDTMYSRGLKDCKDSADLYYGTRLERCYEDINLQQSNGVLWSRNSVGCVDSAFLLNCSGCTNCFGCVNLRHGSYQFMNEQLSKEEYNQRVGEIMGSYKKIEEFKKQFEAFSLQFPRRENTNLKTVDSLGDYLFECKGAFNCFEGALLENCRHAFSSKEMKDSIGTTGYGYSSELLLECVAVGYSSRAIGSYAVDNGRSVEYCFSIASCEDCLGCDALSHSQYYILNKEYSPEEYRELRDHIVAELTSQDLYGLCMPPAIAPFAYNETVAAENMPLSKEEALAQGFRWEDDIQTTRGKETISWDTIPDHIRDVHDSITNEILACQECTRNYRIIPAELSFYRRLGIPLPHKCFNCRHAERVAKRGPYKFFDRTCNKCQKAIKTSFSPDRPEIVYCEQCYQAEVV